MRGLATLANAVSMNIAPPSASAMENTRLQAFKELRSLLSEVLSTAVADEQVPEAFKDSSNWEKLIAQTEHRLAEGWRLRFEGAPDRRQSPRTLELLPEAEELQQMLSERFVNEVSYNDRGPLDELDRQLAALSGPNFNEHVPNPLGPSAWVEGIRGGMRKMNCSPEERDWLMARLIPLLASRITSFYSGMTTRLSSAGYGGRVPVRGNLSGGPPRGGANEYSPDLVPTLGDGQGVFGSMGGGGGGGDAGDGSEALDRLFGLLTARRAPGPEVYGELGGFIPSASVVPWTQADIFSILSLMQGSYASGPGGAAGASSVVRLHEAMGATASQLGLAGSIEAMPGPAQDMLELVSMLFEALLDGRRLDEKARTQLARLIITYVRVAMLDRRMFMQSSHPARRVLNLLVEAFEIAAPDVPHFRSLRELAMTLVDRIVEEFDDTLTLFESLENVLSTEMESCRRRAELTERRAADAQSGKERRQIARESVSSILSDAIVGMSLPSVLLDFLAGPWQHHHTVVLLREGALGDGVQLSRQLLDDLLECSTSGALHDAARLRPTLVEVLASSGQPGSAADEMLVEFSLALAVRQAPDASRTPDEVVAEAISAARVEHVLVDSPQVIVQHTVLAPDAEPVEDSFLVSAVVNAEVPAEIVARYVDFPIGTWLDFIAEDGRVTSARISWTSPISGRRIISNRRGQRMLVASPEELAEMEIEGRLRPRHSESAFEQALHTITDRLQASTATAL